MKNKKNYKTKLIQHHNQQQKKLNLEQKLMLWI